MNSETTSLTQRQAPNPERPEQAELISITPAVDIYENQDEILVVADFPGVPKDSLSIELDRSELLIEGAQAAVEGGQQPIVFSRAFRVPNTVDPDGVTAELTQGVLKVHLAKSEAAKPKRIEVRGG